MKRPSVVTVGNAIAERVLHAPFEVVLGRKYSVSAESSTGGSGADYARPLLAAGFDVFPILHVGEDSSGRSIRKLLLDEAARGGVSQAACGYLRSENFALPDVRTLQSTVIVENGRRTIFSHASENRNAFRENLSRRAIAAEEAMGGPPSAVVIGHIYDDAAGTGEKGGQCTNWLLERYAPGSLVVLNPGNSQLALGFDFWTEVFPRVGILLVNVGELTALFSGADLAGRGLMDMLTELRQRRVTAIVTAGAMGAVGFCAEEPERLCFARPSPLPVVDPTGAGDAFAAGVTANLAVVKRFSFERFCSAVEQARAWSAYACTHAGGSGPCPDEHFMHRLRAADVQEPIRVCRTLQEIKDAVWRMEAGAGVP